MSFYHQWKDKLPCVEIPPQNTQNAQKEFVQPENRVFADIADIAHELLPKDATPTPEPMPFTLEEMPDTVPLPMPFDFSELKPEHCIIQAESCLHCLSWAQRSGLPWWYGTCLRYGHEVTSKSRCVRVPV